MIQKSALYKIAVMLFIPGILVSANPIFAGSTEKWGYNKHNGPAKWVEIGVVPPGLTRQSPVNILSNDAIAKELPPVNFHYGSSVTLEVKNIGTTIKAYVPKGAGELTIDGKVFKLAQFHFHYKSEHEINCKLFEVEMHLVHESDEGKAAVVGILYAAGEKNTELAKIIDVMPAPGGKPVTVKNFDLARLVPADLHSYRYGGSLTTPACDEGVNWIVMASIQTLSEEQIAEFRKLFSGLEFPDGNRRPVQPLNGRQIYTEVKK
jgi:carbonic anhydrase